MQIKNSERRLESRFLCAAVVHVSWPDRIGTRTLEAVLEDISSLGACIQVDEQLPLGVEITLQAEDTILSGIVSYCVYRDYGYFAGVRFLNSHWSTGIFRPEHLIDLRTLVARRTD